MSELPDDPFDPNPDQPDENPVESTSPVPTGNIADRLFDGAAPGPSVQELKGDYGLAREWSIALRGLVRAATGDGIPPVAEILMGSVLGAVKMQRGSDGTSGGTDETTSGPVDPTQENGPNLEP